jgi:squalene-associated FAD-dependent desaturase
MDALDASYRHCKTIASHSGSNFYRSFAILSGARRQAMEALYAFARIIDDASDATESSSSSTETNRNWDAMQWHEWVRQFAQPGEAVPQIRELQAIRLALADAAGRFAIPEQVFHDLIDGVDLDQRGQVVLKTWRELRTYCEQVASSVGIGCLSIWAKEVGVAPSMENLEDARACGIAFQLTNILRDIVEDAKRERCYLPEEDLKRFGIQPLEWPELLRTNANMMHHDKKANLEALLNLYIERADGHFGKGSGVRRSLCLEGQRMFSLMWQTYYAIFQKIKQSPLRVLEGRVSLRWDTKAKLAASHFVTPLYARSYPVIPRLQSNRLTTRVNNDEIRPYKVAVVGAGLAGCNAAIHLARHGVAVELYEAKGRLGGRVGSFVDRESGQSVDYCQHVGMKCCHELTRWIQETGQQSAWTEQTSLHFASNKGEKIAISSLPLPAPLHLANLLWKWPDLSLSDRWSIGSALLKLVRMKPNPQQDQLLATDWLKSAHQSPTSLKNFWETILVSALGEQISRVTLGATRKVLVDGFAASRDAFHLLVPNRPLADLTDARVRHRLEQLGVKLHEQRAIARVEPQDDLRVRLVDRLGGEQTYDRVVIAVPWYQLSDMLELESATQHALSQMQSSPITGIHTWWDRPWLSTPHAILIDRLCQWIFPAPESHAGVTSSQQPNGTYYQIVISASRDLPKGDPEQIAKMIKQDLAEVFPESGVATMLRCKAVTDPNAVFSISPEIANARLQTSHGAERGIYLAGDWTRTGWPATMEGALRSGALAAEQVLQSLAQPARIVIDNS